MCQGSYAYSKLRDTTFTEDGQVMLLKIRDYAAKAIEMSGVVTMGRLLSGSKVTGDTWQMMACVDRLVELGELREVKQLHEVSGQHRIFTSSRL